MKLCLLVVVVVAAGMVSSAGAQTTQPVPESWSKSVERFGALLAAGTSSEECKSFLSDACAIHSFQTSSASLADLLAHTTNAVLLMAKSYSYPADSIATDIAAAASSSSAVPDDAKKLLTPADGSAMRANTTATQWIQRSVSASPGQPVGVLVFYSSDPARTSASESQILFVLVRGQSISTDGFRMADISYGDARQATASVR